MLCGFSREHVGLRRINIGGEVAGWELPRAPQEGPLKVGLGSRAGGLAVVLQGWWPGCGAAVVHAAVGLSALACLQRYTSPAVGPPPLPML
jgi:hypothetical protein